MDCAFALPSDCVTGAQIARALAGNWLCGMKPAKHRTTATTHLPAVPAGAARAEPAKWVLSLLFAGAALCSALPNVASAERIDFSAEGDFSAAAVRFGVKATREQCENLDNAVWVSVENQGEECLRYWAAGFPTGANARAILFFPGDVWLGTGMTGPSYLELSNDELRRGAEEWSKRLEAPYIFFARPGTYGSSGDHMQRRRIAESLLISAALDKIKSRLGIQEFVVAGQSGGGHVTASLITQRSDIICAVPASSPSSPRLRWILKGATQDATGYTDSYEPAEHLEKGKVNERLRVFVLGNPRDTNVEWPSQEILFDKLKQAGIPVEVLHGVGTGPQAHALPNSARIVAGWCFHGMLTGEIRKRAAKGLRG
jgi:hypothetical protein